MNGSDHRTPCLLFLSCIGAGPKYFLQLSDDFRRRYRVTPYLFNDVKNIPEMFAALEPELQQDSLLIYHEPDWLPYLGEVRERYDRFVETIPNHVVKISMPQPCFPAFWPFHCSDPRNDNPDRPLNRYGMLPYCAYGDSQVLRLLRQDLPRDEVISRYLALNVAEEVDLDRLLRQTVTMLERQDRTGEVKVADYILDTFRSNALFQTVNHANNRLLLYMSNKILQLLDCRTVPDSVLGEVMEIIERAMPVHPGIARHFGVTYINADTRYLVDEIHNRTFAEFIKDYVYYSDGLINYNDALLNDPYTDALLGEPYPDGLFDDSAISIITGKRGRIKTETPLDAWIVGHCQSAAYKARVETLRPLGLMTPAVEVALICDLIDFLRPDLVVEIGTFFGQTSRLMAEHLADYGGRLITVDPYGGNRMPEIISGWSEPVREATNFRPIFSMELFAKLGEQEFREGSSGDVGLVFVDGNHKFQYAFFDMMEAAEHLACGGAIVVDNMEQDGPRLAAFQFMRMNPAWKLYYHGRIWSGTFSAADMPSTETGHTWGVLIAPPDIQIAMRGWTFHGKLPKPLPVTGLRLNVRGVSAPVELTMTFLYIVRPPDFHVSGEGEKTSRRQSSVRIAPEEATVDIYFDEPAHLAAAQPGMNYSYELEFAVPDDTGYVLLDADLPYELQWQTAPLLAPPGGPLEPMTDEPLDEWIVAHCQSRAYNAKVEALLPLDLMTPAVEVALICGLIEHLRPSIIVEIGTFFGQTARHMAEAASRHRGRLITVDPFSGDRMRPIIAEWPEPVRAATDFRPISSMDLFTKLEEQGSGHGRRLAVGVVFVDGNHKFEYVTFDIMAAADNLAAGGAIVVDNMEQEGPRHAVLLFMRINPAWKLYYHGQILSGAVSASDIQPPDESDAVWGVLIAPPHYQIAAKGRVFHGKLDQPDPVTGLRLNVRGASAPIEVALTFIYIVRSHDYHITGKGDEYSVHEHSVVVTPGDQSVDLAFDEPAYVELNSHEVSLTFHLEIAVNDEAGYILLDATRPFELFFQICGG